MAVEKCDHDDTFIFLCEDVRCNEICRSGETDFIAARDFAIEEGWTIRRNSGGSWSHFCPDEDLDGLDL